MKTDLYTKAVLTVIALCLLWMSVGGPSLITPVQARADERVVIAGWYDTANSTVRMLDSNGRNALPVNTFNK